MTGLFKLNEWYDHKRSWKILVNYFEWFFFSKITYVSKQTFSTNQKKKKKKTVTEKWTKDNLERQMFSKHIQTFKFISDQKNSNSDQTSLIHPSDQPKKEQGGGAENIQW